MHNSDMWKSNLKSKSSVTPSSLTLSCNAVATKVKGDVFLTVYSADKFEANAIVLHWGSHYTKVT